MGRRALIAFCLLAGVAGSLGSPAKREAESPQPKITYSRATIAALGDEVRLDCGVEGVDLSGVEDFSVSWSKFEEEKPTNSFPISNNERVLLFSNKYTVDHPQDTHQYTLVIKEIADEDTGKYRCTVNFGADQKINADVPVNIQAAPFFTDDLTKTLTVTEGDAISIDCQPGGWPKPEVYWERVNQELPYYGGKLFMSNQLDIPLIARDHRGHYVCYADNGLGSPATSHIILEVQFAPDVTVRKSQVYAGQGEEVAMECSVDAHPAADVAWYKDDQPILGAANMKIARVEHEDGRGVTSTLTISDPTPEMYGTFVCKGVNVLGKTERTIELTTKTPPLIVKQSRAEVLYDAEKALFRDALPVAIECEATGHPEPDYRWTKDGQPLVWQADSRLSLEAGTGNLLISEPSTDDNGMYQCFAYNDLGTAVSDPVYLLNTTRIQFEREDGKETEYEVEAELGRPYRLECPGATGYPKPQLQWVKAVKEDATVKVEYISDERTVSDDEGNLWFAYITEDDATTDQFEYMCLAATEFEPQDYNMASAVRMTVRKPLDGTHNAADDQLNVETFPLHRSPDQVTFQAGQENTLWCIFGGEPAPAVTWQMADGTPLDETRFKTRNFGRTLVFYDTQESDEGVYECVASNGVGPQKTAQMAVAVERKPSLASPLASQTVREGATVTFTCDAEATGEVNYEWKFNGRPIADNAKRTLDGNRLVIEGVALADVGNYACNASSSLGYAYGQAILNVLPSTHRHQASSCGDVAALQKEVTELHATVRLMHEMMGGHMEAVQRNHQQLQAIAARLREPEPVEDETVTESVE